ncbi:MAG: hypothetical protein ABI459_03730 [Deltaproteobacteria bacterium]
MKKSRIKSWGQAAVIVLIALLCGRYMEYASAKSVDGRLAANLTPVVQTN